MKVAWWWCFAFRTVVTASGSRKKFPFLDSSSRNNQSDSRHFSLLQSLLKFTAAYVSSVLFGLENNLAFEAMLRVDGHVSARCKGARSRGTASYFCFFHRSSFNVLCSFSPDLTTYLCHIFVNRELQWSAKCKVA